MTIDPKALEAAARLFLREHGYRCNRDGCDDLAVTFYKSPRSGALYLSCRWHTGDNTGGWDELPQAALVRLLEGEP